VKWFYFRYNEKSQSADGPTSPADGGELCSAAGAAWKGLIRRNDDLPFHRPAQPNRVQKLPMHRIYGTVIQYRLANAIIASRELPQSQLSPGSFAIGSPVFCFLTLVPFHN
jgi:hypothetical protein